MRKTLIIIGTLLVSVLLVLGACAPASAPEEEEMVTEEEVAPAKVPAPAWEVSVESAKTESHLDMRLGGSLQQTTEFYLGDPNMTFLVVGFSLKAMTENNTVDIEEVIVVHSEFGCFHPVGLHISKPMSDWKICTSGTGQIQVLAENEAKLGCDLYYNADNDYGIKNDDITSHHQSLGGSSIIFYQHPMFSFAYVVPSEAISRGQLWLQLRAAQSVKLVVTS